MFLFSLFKELVLKLKKKNNISIINTTVTSKTYKNPVKNSTFKKAITIPNINVFMKKYASA